MLRSLTITALLFTMAVSSLVAADGPFVIGFSEFELGRSWRVQSREEFRYAAQNDDDVEHFIVTVANGNIGRQVRDIEALIERKVDAIIVNAGSPDELVPVIERAVEAGIVVVDFDHVTTTDKAYHVTPDGEAAGRISAEALVEAIAGNGKILCFNGVQGSQLGEERYQGALETLRKANGIDILSTVYGGWDYTQAKRAIESLFAAYPEIDAVWSQGGSMSEAILDAYHERGLNAPYITGEPTNGFLLACARAAETNPDFDAVAVGTPPWISAEAMRLAIRVLKGEEVARTTTLPVDTVGKDAWTSLADPTLPHGVYADTKLPKEVLRELWAE